MLTNTQECSDIYDCKRHVSFEPEQQPVEKATMENPKREIKSAFYPKNVFKVQGFYLTFLFLFMWINRFILLSEAKFAKGKFSLQEEDSHYLTHFGCSIGRCNYQFRVRLMNPFTYHRKLDGTTEKNQRKDARKNPKIPILPPRRNEQNHDVSFIEEQKSGNGNNDSSVLATLRVFLDEEWERMNVKSNGMVACHQMSESRVQHPFQLKLDGQWSNWVNGSVFQSVRPHMWFFVVDECSGLIVDILRKVNNPPLPPQLSSDGGVNISDSSGTDSSHQDSKHQVPTLSSKTPRQHMTNYIHISDLQFQWEGKLLQSNNSHFSYELMNTLYVSIFHVLTFALLLLYMVVRETREMERSGKIHKVVQTLNGCVLCQLASSILQLVHSIIYHFDGRGSLFLDTIGAALSLCSQVAIASILISIAMGCTLNVSVTKGAHIESTAIPVGVIVGMLHIILVVLDRLSYDPRFRFHTSDGFLNLMLLLLRMVLWGVFIVCGLRTLSVVDGVGKHERSEREGEGSSYGDNSTKRVNRSLVSSSPNYGTSYNTSSAGNIPLKQKLTPVLSNAAYASPLQSLSSTHTSPISTPSQSSIISTSPHLFTPFNSSSPIASPSTIKSSSHISSTHTSTSLFLKRFISLGSIYFLSYPIVILIAALFAPYLKQKVITHGLFLMQVGVVGWMASLFLRRGEYFRISDLSMGYLPGGYLSLHSTYRLD